MSADPADDTNALLAQNNALLLQLVSGRNDTASLNSTLPSASFSPSGAILSVNVLFALSLAFAIISSFLAVLGRQWLVYYRKRGGGGPDRQRWEQLKRFLGAERWGLELILDDILPSLLQAGLIIFCVSFLIYLNTLNSTLHKVVSMPLYAGLAFFVGSALCMLWDRFCPFHSPLSHLLHCISFSASRIFRVIMPLKRHLTSLIKGRTLSSEGFGEPPSPRSRQAALANRVFGWLKPIGHRFIQPFSVIKATAKKLLSHVQLTRQEEKMRSLQVIAIQRTICTSEDPATLLHATANILSITDLDQLNQLWGDELFRERFLELRRTSYDRAIQLRGRDQFEFAACVARLYCASATHVLISVHSTDVDSSVQFQNLPRTSESNRSCFWIPSDRLASSSPMLIAASLISSTSATFWYLYSRRNEKAFCIHLAAYCAALNGQSWRLLSVISWIVSRLRERDRPLVLWQGPDLESLRTSYVGCVAHPRT